MKFSQLSQVTLALLAAAGVVVGGSALAQPSNKEARDVAVQAAETRYKADKSTCGALSGNAKDICMEEAKGREKVGKAEANAMFANTPKAREDARVAKADAEYGVAKEKCDDLAGNVKDVCVEKAKAALTKAKADAKVDRVASDGRTNTAQRTADAQRSANDDKRDAEYKVAIEKCDALAGNPKDVCVRDAKSRYGKS